ncbi:MAG: hypothetical protein AAF730_03230 [Bacteroidota bacterium]
MKTPLMNHRLPLIEHLYGERSDAADLQQRLDADAEARAEYAALSEAKFRLDLRKPARPDAAVLDQIMQAAAFGETPAATHTSLRSRSQRTPVAPQRRSLRKRMAVLVGTLTVVIAAVGLSVDRTTTAPSDTTAVTMKVNPELFQQAGAPSAVAPVDQAATAIPATSALAWDDTEDVIDLHHRLKQLDQRTQSLWDTPAMPLEMLPGTRATTAPRPMGQTGIQQVRQQR